MIRMNVLMFMVGMFFLNSCGQIEEKKQLFEGNKEMVVSDKIKPINLDSLSVKYWKSTEANEYWFKYSDNSIQISSQYFSLNRKILKESTISKFLNYIEVFFISKTQAVEITRERRKESIITDYPVLTVKCYKSGKEIINRTIQIGEEEFEIKYTPEFIEFYEFLDDLIATK